MSRVSRRRVLRGVSLKGSLCDPRWKRKETERKEWKESLGEMERNVRDEEKGRRWSKGGIMCTRQ